MPQRPAAIVVLLLLGLAAPPVASADSLLSFGGLFTGRNIYSPNTQAVSGGQVMWYGGWQTQADQTTGDKIYRRTANSAGTWSAPTTVLTAASMPGGTASWRHVNDPSVTQTNKALPYTMFFTACRNPCGIASGAELWSAESANGVSWTNLKKLLGGWPHPAEPAAIVEPSGSQIWKVYYTDRAECQKIKVVSVNAARDAFNVRTVHSTSQSFSCLLNPEVRFFNGNWHLFYERDTLSITRDVEEAESSSNTSFSSFSTLIEFDENPTYCAAIGPGVRPVGGTDYDLDLGLTTRRPDGSCDVSFQENMVRARFRDDDSSAALDASRLRP